MPRIKIAATRPEADPAQREPAQLRTNDAHRPARPGAGVSRRRMLGQMAGGLAGASLALPLAAQAASLPLAPRRPLSPLPDAMPAPAPAAAEWQPRFLDAHQVATLVVLGERIAPGSAAAKTHEFIDLLLSVIPADAEQHFRTGNNVPRGTVRIGPRARQRLLDALGAFDAQARRRYGQPFTGLTPAQQDAILSAAESAAADSPAQQHFTAARNWVLGAFYSSQPGIRELGWTGRLFFSSYPNCSAV